MTIFHITNDIASASGVGMFVRRLDSELRKLGIDSRIVGQIDDLPPVGSKPPADTVFHIHGLWLGLHHRAAVRARRLGVGLVWSTHGMTSPWAMRHKLWKKWLPWRLYQKSDLESASVVHCTTPLEVAWNRSLGLVRTKVVPIGADIPDYAARHNRKDSHTLLFVGRLYPVKAIDRLIAAFQMVPHCGWRLRIVGPDQSGHLAELKKLAGCDVDFVGPRFGADLDAEYDGCDALALVSHTENFGATVVDAMAHGKPVITSTHTPWQSVAGECGWWVDNDPSVLSLALSEMMAMSDDERAALGARGRERAEREFSWKSVAKCVLEMYSGCVREKP